MLLPARFVDKNKLERKVYDAITKEENKFYRFTNYQWFDIGESDDDSENKVRVSVDEEGEILALFSCSYNRMQRRVDSCSFIKFKKDSEIAKKDLRDYFEGLLFDKNTDKVKFGAIENNPANAVYLHWCKKYGGRMVGIYIDEVTLLDGEKHNLVSYEFFREKAKKVLTNN